MPRTFSYLGPPGTFSEIGAKDLAARFGGSHTLVPFKSFDAIVASVTADTAGETLAVLPYYNLLEGVVVEALDAAHEAGLHAIAATRVPIVFFCGRSKGEPSAAQPRVYSHPKALAQCSSFIASLDAGQCEICPVTSTAEAVKKVLESGGGYAIASEQAVVGAGLDVIARDVGNRAHGRANFTEFVLYSREAMPPLAQPAANAVPRSLVAFTPSDERPGLLAEVLACIAFFGINLAKIHSRPAVVPIDIAIEPQMFYFEMTEHPESERLRKCLDAIMNGFHLRSGQRPIVSVIGGFYA